MDGSWQGGGVFVWNLSHFELVQAHQRALGVWRESQSFRVISLFAESAWANYCWNSALSSHCNQLHNERRVFVEGKGYI